MITIRTRADCERVIYALECYYVSLGDALRARYSEHGDTPACALLRLGMRETEDQLEHYRETLRARDAVTDTSAGL